jgi:tetratricopeptide (TPR) repeat protein
MWNNPAPLSPAQAAEAQAGIREALDLALDRARNEEERNSATVTRIYLSNDWTGFAGASARQLAGRNCVMTEFNDAPVALGHAGRAQDFYRLAVACDPLAPEYYWNLARALLWAGDAAQALAVIDESKRRGAYDARNAWVAAVALAALKRYDEAEALAASGEGTTEITRAHYDVLIAAARGQGGPARAKWAALPPTLHSPRNDLLLQAWMGDRDAANAIAREIDRQAFGNVALAELTLHCVCGAPFDIEQTPNFKARIAESGFAWPPRKPVPIPLKDW